MSKSLINNNKECYVCKTKYNIHKHHVFEGTANRKISEADGCWIYLCAFHHNMSNEGIHFNRKLDLYIKRLCEKSWIDQNGKTIDDFIKRYGKNYLE